MRQGKSRLIDMETGTLVRITSIESSQGIMVKLNRFGLFAGDLARILRHAPFEGPVLLEVRGMEIALGRGIASRILVEEAPCDSP